MAKTKSQEQPVTHGVDWTEGPSLQFSLGVGEDAAAGDRRCVDGRRAGLGRQSSAAEGTRAASVAARRRAIDAGRSVGDVVPGRRRDSVAELMHDADSAAEFARQREAEAVRLAQQAKEDTEQAARTSPGKR